ncbi:MAG: hypothetical protein ACI4VF_06145 [Lachnospirales bacterium]
MLVENIRHLHTIVDGSNDEKLILKQIISSIKQKLKIDIVIADKKGNSIFNIPFKGEDYFFKIPLKSVAVKYGMIYVNGIDNLSQNELAFFYSTIPIISILLRNIYNRNDSNIKRQIKASRVVIGSLTVSEYKALVNVFKYFDKNEGIVVISRIAKESKITRSIIVNAIKKIESAGIVDSRSLGMKGTKISVNNKYFISELRNSYYGGN